MLAWKSRHMFSCWIYVRFYCWDAHISGSDDRHAVDRILPSAGEISAEPGFHYLIV